MTDGRFRISPIFSSYSFSPTSIDISDSTTFSLVTSMTATEVIIKVNDRWFEASNPSADGVTWTASVSGVSIGNGDHSVKYFCYNDVGGDEETDGNTLSITSTNVTYATVLNVTQENIRDIIIDDSTCQGFIRSGVSGDYAYNVFDGTPVKVARNLATYIIVHTPELKEKRLTLGPSAKMDLEITENIEVVGKKEGQVRELSDAVRNALFTNQDITKARKLKLYSVDRSSLRQTYISPVGDAEKPVWTCTLSVRYVYRGR